MISLQNLHIYLMRDAYAAQRTRRLHFVLVWWYEKLSSISL